MPAFNDLTGQRFGRLQVLLRVPISGAATHPGYAAAIAGPSDMSQPDRWCMAVLAHVAVGTFTGTPFTASRRSIGHGSVSNEIGVEDNARLNSRDHARRDAGESLTNIARSYNVSHTTIDRLTIAAPALALAR